MSGKQDEHDSNEDGFDPNDPTQRYSTLDSDLYELEECLRPLCEQIVEAKEHVAQHGLEKVFADAARAYLVDRSLAYVTAKIAILEVQAKRNLADVSERSLDFMSGKLVPKQIAKSNGKPLDNLRPIDGKKVPT